MALAKPWQVAVLAAALGGAVAPVPAAALEIFGIRLFGGEDEPPVEGSIPYEVTVEAGDDRRLTRVIRDASRLVDEADEPSPGDAALLSRARGDYQRVVAALYAEGYYGPTVSILVNGQEAVDLPVDAELGEQADVTLRVNPGPSFVFGNVRVENQAPPILGDRDLPRLPEELGLRPSEPARSTVILASEAAVVGRWREAGYPKATIADETAVARHEANALDVAIVAEPGRPAVFGDVTVTGTDRMDPYFVAWYAGIEPGQPFDPDDLERARDQLRRLEVFQASRFLEADAITPEGTLPIEIQVAESKRRVFGFGANYSTLDGFGVEGYWRHRNLFGRAEKLRLDARVGGIGAENPDEYNYRIGATFLKPGVFTPYTDLIATVYGEQEAPDTYRERTVGGRIGLSHRIGERITLEGSTQLELSTIDQTQVGDGDFVMASLPLSLAYDGSNNALNPTHGYRARVRAEPFYELNRGNLGLITELDGSVYYGFGAQDRLVLAARAATGSITGAPLDDIPASRLFFAGGGGSIRGYPYREVGPRNADGKVTGGRSYFVGSVEARVAVTQTIGVVPFVDFGNAFESELPDFSEELKFAVGGGIRYNTGLGPIRLDVAVPLDAFEGDPEFAFYIGLGQAF